VDVVVEIGEGEKRGCGEKRELYDFMMTGEQWSGNKKMQKRAK
jgi:hypothetical protein